MKRKIKIIISTFACLTMMFNLVACSQENNVSTSGSTTSEEDNVTLKLSYGHGISDPAKSDETAFGYYFKEYIDEHCDSINVQLYGGATLGSSEDVMGSIAANTVEMGVYEVGTLNNYDPETMVFSLPGAFRDSEEVNYMIDSQWAKDFFEESSKNTNLMVLGGACKGMRCFNVEGYELREVEDIAGLTLRVMDTPLYVELIEALGANPVPMAMSEVYVAIQNNVIDGQENPVVNIVNNSSCYNAAYYESIYVLGKINGTYPANSLGLSPYAHNGVYFVGNGGSFSGLYSVTSGAFIYAPETGASICVAADNSNVQVNNSWCDSAAVGNNATMQTQSVSNLWLAMGKNAKYNGISNSKIDKYSYFTTDDLSVFY